MSALRPVVTRLFAGALVMTTAAGLTGCIDSSEVDTLVRDQAVDDLRCDWDDIELEVFRGGKAREVSAIAAGCGRSAKYQCRYVNQDWTCRQRPLL